MTVTTALWFAILTALVLVGVFTLYRWVTRQGPSGDSDFKVHLRNGRVLPDRRRQTDAGVDRENPLWPQRRQHDRRQP